MNRPSFHVKKGDKVTVISGNHSGGEGKIIQVLPKKGQVLIEGVRLIKRHVRKSQDNPQGAIIEKEGPVHISNVRLSDRERAGQTPEKPKRKVVKSKS